MMLVLIDPPWRSRMKLKSGRTVLIPLILVLSSCSSSSRNSAPSSSAQAQSKNSAVASTSAQPTYSIPKDAQVTIFCARIQGTAHVERATRMRDDLIKSTGMKDWYVIIENEQTLL